MPILAVKIQMKTLTRVWTYLWFLVLHMAIFDCSLGLSRGYLQALELFGENILYSTKREGVETARYLRYYPLVL